MGFLDPLLGRRKLKGPAPDRLFAITTAAVTLETSHGIRTRGAAAIVFQPLATEDFRQIATEMEEVVRGTGDETGTKLETVDDEDLAVAVNAVTDALALGGYAERVLCSVFAFEDSAGPLYFIYNYKRGSWYPFAPASGEQQRSTERELQVKAKIGAELPLEPELERWFPLWGIPI
jgi:hypothetical protein